jgi:hypothetical protein
MVDLATFRTFPRASPGRQSAALVAEQDVPAEKGTLTDEALQTRFTQELRAQRRAARTDLRQSEAWAEPEVAPPFVAPLPEPVDLVHTPPALAEPPEPDLEHPGPQGHVAHEGAQAEPETQSVEYQALPGEVPGPHEDFVVPDPPVVHEPHGEMLQDPSIADNEPVFLEPEPPTSDSEYDEGSDGSPSSHEEPIELSSQPHASLAEQDESAPQPLVVHEEPIEAVHVATPEAALEEPAPTLPSPPVPIHEFLAVAAEERARQEAPWPSKPVDEVALPIAPPEPLESETTDPIAAAPEPEIAEAPLVEGEMAAPEARTDYRSDSLLLDYRLLGLANPLVCTVTGKLGDAAPIELTIGRTGLYRPDGFRPAPWSGFAYDVSPDGRTGLVLGTRVLTARGEVPVEDLVPGDTALALRGPALLPIVWIGRSIAALPPVEIAADAFGPGRPGKTLRVGADHPIFMQNMPVLASDLVNGDTIRTLETETAELFHIDVGFAEVLLAEGVPLSSGCR